LWGKLLSLLSPTSTPPATSGVDACVYTSSLHPPTLQSQLGGHLRGPSPDFNDYPHSLHRVPSPALALHSNERSPASWCLTALLCSSNAARAGLLHLANVTRQNREGACSGNLDVRDIGCLPTWTLTPCTRRWPPYWSSREEAGSVGQQQLQLEPLPEALTRPPAMQLNLL
jgi:hypothetical protein